MVSPLDTNRNRAILRSPADPVKFFARRSDVSVKGAGRAGDFCRIVDEIADFSA